MNDTSPWKRRPSVWTWPAAAFALLSLTLTVNAAAADEGTEPATADEATAAPEETAPTEKTESEEAAPAEETAATDDDIETVIVTGSRIPRPVREAGPEPVTSVSRDDIEKSGQTSVSDVLTNLSQNAGGTLDQSYTFGFTPGASSIDLRGFGAGRTLVLLDGRRLPAYPIGISGTDSFVDLSTIPTVMIERIEVLTDGASAIYGSDAISGVVNIITRKTIDGSFASVRLGGTDDGGYANQRAQFVTGMQTEDSSSMLFAEYYHNNALPMSKRDYADSDFNGSGVGSIYGSTFIGDDDQVIPDPNCGTPNDSLGGQGVPNGAFCGFDRSKYRQFIPDITRGSVALNYNRDVGDVESFSRLSYTETTTITRKEPNAYAGGEGYDSSTPDAQVINESIHNRGDVAAGASNNPTTGTGNQTDGFYLRRLVEYGPRGSEIDSRAMNLLTGLRGTFADFTWDVGFSYNRQKVIDTRPNIISSVLDNEVANRGLNLFEPISPDIVARTSFEQIRKTKSQNALIDATVAGPLPVELSGGPVQLAVHFDGSREAYADRPDPLSILGDAFDGSTSGGGSRKYAAIGSEFSLPVLDNLELDIAGRYDRYYDDSDVGGKFSPQGKLIYRPVESLYVRASAGKSFRAPDLQRLFGGTVKAFDSAIDSVSCVEQGGTPGQTDSIPACVEPVQSIAIRVSSNEELEAERGTNYSVGMGWELIEALTVKLDYFDVELKNIVVDPSTQSILDNCAEEGQFCDQIQYADVDTNGDGQLLDETDSLIILRAQNLAKQRIKGVDGEVSYRFAPTGFGEFNANYTVTWIDQLKLQLTEDDDETDQIDYAAFPEYRMSGKLDWALGNLGAFIRVDYVGDYAGQFAEGPKPPKSQYIASWTTWDAQVRYAFGKWGSVRIGVDNIFNRGIPLDPTAQGGNRPNQFIDAWQLAFHNGIGRAGYVQYEVQF